MNHEAIVEALRKAREAAHMNMQAGELLDDIDEESQVAEKAEAASASMPAEPETSPAPAQTDASGTTGAPAPGKPLSRFPEPAPIEGRLTSSTVRVPPEIERCSGIVVHGQRIRSFAYSTDVAVIRNTNADAILAVYPFTGHPIITQAILSVAKAPVFTGVGGGTTTGQRVLELAMFAEMQGVQGVVLNAPAPVETVRQLAGVVDVPVVATILAWDDEARAKVEAGARIVNVAAGRATTEVVRALREEMPELPVIATGGKSGASILETIEAGANAISWTPPDAQQLQLSMMEAYRAGERGHAAEQPAHGHPRLSSWLAEKGL